MKHLHHVHLNGLRAIEAIGRLGSLRAAAEEIGVTPGAISQHLQRTEQQLGRTLYERTPRGLVPVDSARAILERLTAGLRLLDEAVALAVRRTGDTLTLSVAPVFAAKWLVPRLGRFAERHPGLRVRLDATVALVDPAAGDVDVAIRVGDGAWPGVRTDFLLPQEVFPICAPALARHLRAPADLATVPIVRDANSNLSWNLWLAPLGLDEAMLQPGNSFNDASLALDAAIAGQGVMLAWQTLAHDALAAGLVVAPFPERTASGLGYWLITAKDRRDDTRVAAFRRWMHEEIASTARDFS